MAFVNRLHQLAVVQSCGTAHSARPACIWLEQPLDLRIVVFQRLQDRGLLHSSSASLPGDTWTASLSNFFEGLSSQEQLDYLLAVGQACTVDIYLSRTQGLRPGYILQHRSNHNRASYMSAL